MPGWLGQLSIQLSISAQVMLSRFVESSPASGSALTLWSMLGISSLPLSLFPSSIHTLSVSKLKKKKNEKDTKTHPTPRVKLAKSGKRGQPKGCAGVFGSKDLEIPRLKAGYVIKLGWWHPWVPKRRRNLNVVK